MKNISNYKRNKFDYLEMVEAFKKQPLYIIFKIYKHIPDREIRFYRETYLASKNIKKQRLSNKVYAKYKRKNKKN